MMIQELFFKLFFIKFCLNLIFYSFFLVKIISTSHYKGLFMYLFNLFSIFIIGFLLLGCANRGYPPAKEKKSFALETDSMASSVHETVGRYRVKK